MGVRTASMTYTGRIEEGSAMAAARYHARLPPGHRPGLPRPQGIAITDDEPPAGDVEQPLAAQRAQGERHRLARRADRLRDLEVGDRRRDQGPLGCGHTPAVDRLEQELRQAPLDVAEEQRLEAV